MASVIYSHAALKALKKLAVNVRATLVSKIEQYAEHPDSLANNVTKLQGRTGYRLRVGGWRVIFERIEQDSREVLFVLDVMPRGDDYKR